MSLSDILNRDDDCFDAKKNRCRWNRQNRVLAVTFLIVVATGIASVFFSKCLTFSKPKLFFYEWVWPHQTVNHLYLSEFDHCGLWATQCQMSGARFLVGTFEADGQYISYLSARDTLSFKKPIGLVWRLEFLVSPYLVAREIKSALNFFSDLEIPVEFLVIDYDSPSKKLSDYADWINELSAQQLQQNVSTTGLVSWSHDNPDGFEVLLEAAEEVSLQLYQGSKRFLLNDNLVSAIERYDNVHISMYCPDTGFLDYFFKKVSISRPLNIGIFDSSTCNIIPKR